VRLVCRRRRWWCEICGGTWSASRWRHSRRPSSLSSLWPWFETPTSPDVTLGTANEELPTGRSMRWADAFQCASSLVRLASSSRVFSASISGEKPLIEARPPAPNVFAAGPPKSPSESRAPSTRQATKSWRLRAMAIEHHRRRIYEIYQGFDTTLLQ